jgi:predicted nucleotidyltransferase
MGGLLEDLQALLGIKVDLISSHVKKPYMKEALERESISV